MENKLEEVMTAQGMTVEELSQASGLSVPWLKKALDDPKRLKRASSMSVVHLAEALDVNTEYLLDVTDMQTGYPGPRRVF